MPVAAEVAGWLGRWTGWTGVGLSGNRVWHARVAAAKKRIKA
jgi:hypothetical protein